MLSFSGFCGHYRCCWNVSCDVTEWDKFEAWHWLLSMMSLPLHCWLQRRQKFTLVQGCCLWHVCAAYLQTSRQTSEVALYRQLVSPQGWQRRPHRLHRWDKREKNNYWLSGESEELAQRYSVTLQVVHSKWCFSRPAIFHRSIKHHVTPEG